MLTGKNVITILGSVYSEVQYIGWGKEEGSQKESGTRDFLSSLIQGNLRVHFPRIRTKGSDAEALIHMAGPKHSVLFR